MLNWLAVLLQVFGEPSVTAEPVRSPIHKLSLPEACGFHLFGPEL